MDEVTPKYLPEGTILTTEGKDRILTGKLQRNVAFRLADSLEHGHPTLAELNACMHDAPPQNVHRTVKALEAKGVLKTVKGVKGEIVIHHCIGFNDDGEMYIHAGMLSYFGEHEALMPGGSIVGNHDYVAAMDEVMRINLSDVFKSIKYARENNKRWYVAEFNKPSLYKLAAAYYWKRVDLDRALEAWTAAPLHPLVEQAARGAWQPFFDTLKKNKVIQYHNTEEGRVMIWDARRWMVYSTRVLKERQAIIDSWKV